MGTPMCLVMKQAIATSGVNIDKHRSISEEKLEEKYSESKIGQADVYSSKLDKVCDYDNL